MGQVLRHLDIGTAPSIATCVCYLLQGTGAIDSTCFIKYREDQFHGFVTSKLACKRMASLTEEFLPNFREDE